VPRGGTRGIARRIGVRSSRPVSLVIGALTDPWLAPSP